ncbi:MAG: 3-hydroxyacyl-CoA dehydrogenase [Syntrophomonas sp.]
MELKNKTAIVTGGASGLGEAAVRRFAWADANAVILDLNEERGRSLVAELGSRVVFIKTDVTNPDDVKEAVKFTIEKFGQVDILVNCAAIAIARKTADPKEGPHDLNLFKKVVDINLIGCFDVIRNTATAMLANEPGLDGERGVIINTASAAAFEGQVGQVAYAATKAAIVGMTLPLARELSSAGIRVVTIAPGIFMTPMLRGLPENIREALGKMVPFPKRLGKPDEYAMMVQHIVENTMLNGETIRLDGAIRMQPK